MVKLDEQTRSGVDASSLKHQDNYAMEAVALAEGIRRQIVVFRPVEHLQQLRRRNGSSRVTGRWQADPRDDG